MFINHKYLYYTYNMNKCLFKCDPKYIGNWYNTIIDNLETRNFKIEKSKYLVI